MPVKWDFFQRANKTEVQGFKTCKTLTQRLKRATAEATLCLSLLKKFCPHLQLQRIYIQAHLLSNAIFNFFREVYFWFLPSSPQISPTKEPLWQPFSNKYLFPELAKLIILAKLINPATAEQSEELHHVATGLLHTNKYVTNQ